MTAVNSRETLRAAVALSGLTQEQVAERVGRDVSTISRWLNGRTDPGFVWLDKLADALGQPLVLTFGTRKSDPPPQWATGLITDVPAIRADVEKVVNELVTLKVALEAIQSGLLPPDDDPADDPAPLASGRRRGR